jgi:uncharacterized protein YndB with AHSA1/START domain
MEKLTAKATIGIQKAVSEVFEAIVDPDKMQNYFISKSSGRMEVGKEILWSFPEFEGSYPLTTKEIIPNEKIVFIWDPESVVTIEFQKFSDNDTVVKVSEEGHQSDEKGIKWAIGQTEGWANFLACMKAWLEYGIHLRKGAFDFMKTD